MENARERINVDVLVASVAIIAKLVEDIDQYARSRANMALASRITLVFVKRDTLESSVIEKKNENDPSSQEDKQIYTLLLDLIVINIFNFKHLFSWTVLGRLL